MATKAKVQAKDRWGITELSPIHHGAGAGMQGYLETLLTKGDSLTVEEQRRYLQTG